MNDQLLIHEIYKSIQGESTFAGLPCIFVRLTGCDLRCHYCDSAYAFTGGERMLLPSIVQEVVQLDCNLVEITGGEPMLQKNVLPLMKSLCDQGLTVLLETSGAHDLSLVDPRVIRIMDWKCPSSGERARNLQSNVGLLRKHDEIKFVIGSREDFDWARKEVLIHSMADKVGSVLFSPTFVTAGAPGQTQGHPGLDSRSLAEWIIADKLPVRFQLQMHKYVWEPTKRGV